MIFKRTQYVGDFYAFKQAIVDPNPLSLLLIFGFNQNAATRYLMLFNSQLFPPNGTGAFTQIKIPGEGTFSLGPFFTDLQSGGIDFSIGLSLQVSTTPDVLTLSATNDISASFQIGYKQ